MQFPSNNLSPISRRHSGAAFSNYAAAYQDFKPRADEAPLTSGSQ